jgi:hypothetical protein
LSKTASIGHAGKGERIVGAAGQSRIAVDRRTGAEKLVPCLLTANCVILLGAYFTLCVIYILISRSRITQRIPRHLIAINRALPAVVFCYVIIRITIFRSVRINYTLVLRRFFVAAF